LETRKTFRRPKLSRKRFADLLELSFWFWLLAEPKLSFSQTLWEVNMMLLVGILCAAAAATLSAIVFHFSSLSSLKAFLLSVLVVFICGFALYAKEAALKKGISPVAKWLTFVVAIAILSPAAKPYLSVWHETYGFWSVAFLLWLALLALITVWLPLQAGEQQ
jgi:hypothetical protein